MRARALIALIFALTIRLSRCQPYSAISCAVGRTSISPKSQDLITRLYWLTDSAETRATKDYVFYYLYSKENPGGEQIFFDEPNRLGNFKPDRPTKIITHGYLSSKESPACVQPRDAFLNSGDYNVIVVDWWAMQSIWSTLPLDYWTVTGYVGEVGGYVAAMINFLENNGMNLETTTLIGHSLGAHVMGVAGYQLKNKVNYIVGLDPALPSFESRSPGERLSVEDAKVVEVIHTNNGDCGMPDQVGHYDFYPNGGSKQPGCSSNTCSHSRVFELYAESIYSENGFYGRRCTSFEALEGGKCFGDIAVMGGSVKEQTAPQGMYYLETRDSFPYALGK